MRIDELNAVDDPTAVQALMRCCGSSRWARRLASMRPFAGIDALVTAADAIWWALEESDWREAFAAHPEIGGSAGDPGDAESAAPTKWSVHEQAGVARAGDQLRRQLAEANRKYRSRFGYIFIVCATGRTADDMLERLETRLRHDPHDELRVAAEEQRKITQLRLAKLLEEEPERG